MKVRHQHESSSSMIFLMVLAILIAVCVGPASAATEPGTVTIVVAAEPHSLDAVNSTTSDVGQVLVKNVLEPLTAINPDDSRVLPRLATSWKQIDANTWQFSLRKGVKFHDGADFNAEAVIFNIKRLYDKRINSMTRNKFFSGFKMECKALDSYTLEIKTDKVEPLLPTLMGILNLCSPNTPADKWTRNPVGTGPYKFVKWDAGTQIILERFDGYWGKRPQVKKAVYLWRNESSVRAAMVEIGEADLVPIVARQDATRPDLDYSYFNSETTYLRIGAWEPPLNDRRVRLALNYAVDRNAIRGSILSKDVMPATQMVIPNIFGYNPDLKVWPYDLQKAKELIDEARKDGVPVDKEILLVGRIGQYPNQEEVLEALATMYKTVGLNVKPRLMEAGAFRPYNYKPYPKDARTFLLSNQHDNNSGDPVFTVFAKYHCDGGGSAICDKKLDDLIVKAQSTTGEERKSLWREVFKRIYEDIVGDVMLFHMVGFTRVGKRINFKPSFATNSEIPLADMTFKE